MDYSRFAFVYTQNDENDPLPGMMRDAGFGYMHAISPADPLREAFVCALAEDCDYVIAADAADGFQAEDILRVADALLEDDSALYMGTRTLSGKAGLWENLFGFLSGISAAASSTSLVGMSAATCSVMVNMKSSDKAYRYNIPLEARAQSIPVKETQTGAPPAPQPGFSLLTRSFKLYYVFIKFSISATIAYIVDIGAFYLFEQVFASLTDEYKILWATVFSRILCSIATYFLNKGAVFHSHARTTGVVVRFIIMSAGQLLASWLLVWGIGSLLGASDVTNMLLKVIVDLVIFLVSFPLQRDWVFKEKGKLLG